MSFEQSIDYERRALNLLEANQLVRALVLANLAMASAIREASSVR